MSTQKMTAVAEELGKRRVDQLQRELLATDCPEGIRVEPSVEGVCLVGRGLRRRLLSDVRLRNFGR